MVISISPKPCYMYFQYRIFLLSLVLCFSCIEQPVRTQKPVAKLDFASPDSLTANDIMRAAHQYAGGEFWSNPKSLSLFGYGRFYANGKLRLHEKHNMYRVYEENKEAAHQANGKVRIESYHQGKPIILLTFDGQNTYDLNGKRDPSAADQQWASSFGFGVIRHVFDPGYRLERLANDWIDGEPTYTIKVIDPTGGETIFGIGQTEPKILMVGFDTPRGWHERKYANFFTKAEYNWQQAGLVRLYYNAVKTNEVVWEDFKVNEVLADSLFVLD